MLQRPRIEKVIKESWRIKINVKRGRRKSKKSLHWQVFGLSTQYSVELLPVSLIFVCSGLLRLSCSFFFFFLRDPPKRSGRMRTLWGQTFSGLSMSQPQRDDWGTFTELSQTLLLGSLSCWEANLQPFQLVSSRQTAKKKFQLILKMFFSQLFSTCCGP